MGGLKLNNTNWDFFLKIHEIFQSESDFKEKLAELAELLNSSFDGMFQIAIRSPLSECTNSNTIFSFPVEAKGDTYAFVDVYGKESRMIDIEAYSNFFESLSKLIGYYYRLEMEREAQRSDATNQFPFSLGVPELEQMLSFFLLLDPHMLSVISRKMLHYLLYKGIGQAKDIFNKIGLGDFGGERSFVEVNKPSQKKVLKNILNYSTEIFQIAVNHLKPDEITFLVKKWFHEEKASSLVKFLANESVTLKEIAEEIRKFYTKNFNIDEIESQYGLSPSFQGIRVSLTRKLLSDQLEYIQIAKNFISLRDFYRILQRTIISTEGMGRLGGKAAGVILSKKIIETYARSSIEFSEPARLFSLEKIKVPKSWYIPSDSFYDFLYYNNLEDIIEQKYKPLDEIRNEYPNIVQLFKNSQFPPELVNGLSRALDDFGDSPIIVRSSSLLEDRLGASFPGKYKSIFIANQGTKEERLAELTDAIAEVYASVFSPDPIGYRIEHKLLDFNEEMGIILQEVVGRRVGKYFFPAFAGVAFSLNEFRWSPRIQREDGLLRIVLGLGTRAVDRVGDDYPIMVAPGKPEIRVYTSVEDYLLYSPKKIDVINLETKSFEALEVNKLLNEIGNNYPMMNYIFSIYEEKSLRNPVGININAKSDELIPTFENLFRTTNLLKVIHKLLKILSKELGVPVDIEFACDGEDLYILQCRSQSSVESQYRAEIPKKIPQEDLFLRTSKFISNGKIPDLEFIVYVDPQNYSRLDNLKDFLDVAEAVGKLNKILPKKKFALFGPGRWGTRDDVRLGVKVTYSDINNTALLVEIASKVGSYMPDLSFGTHFFQDLVESDIKYLPLFLDDETYFNDFFIQRSQNLLNDLVEGYSHISLVLKVVNVTKETKGKVLRILMNAEESLAVGFFVQSSVSPVYLLSSSKERTEIVLEEPWEIRWKFVEKIIDAFIPKNFGVYGVYLYGTVYSKSAKETSDVDLLVHYDGKPENILALKSWFEPWNYLLRELIYIRTGYKPQNPLDVDFVTNEEIKSNSYLADLINPTKKLSFRLC